MKRVALLGGGYISKEHQAAYARLRDEGRARIVACAGGRRERFADLGDIRYYADIPSLLAGERGKSDFVDDCLPTFLHADVACAALASGYDVLSEKPMALNLAEGTRMLEAARSASRTLMIGHCMRFNPYMALFREFVDSGVMGRVRWVGFTRYQGVGRYASQGWLTDGARCGGALLDLHIHDVDTLVWLFGIPQAVSVMGQKVFPNGGIDALSAQFRYGDFFAQATCDWTIDANRFEGRTMRVNFENGYVFNDRADKGREAFCAVWHDGREEDLLPRLGADTEMYNQISYFVDCLESGEAPALCMPESSLDTLRVCMAEEASAQALGALTQV